jgi:hypothetical protein
MIQNKMKNIFNKISNYYTIEKILKHYVLSMLFLLLLVLLTIMFAVYGTYFFIYFYESLEGLSAFLFLTFIFFGVCFLIINILGKKKLFWFTLVIMLTILFLGTYLIHMLTSENFLTNLFILLSFVFISVPLMMKNLNDIYYNN